MAFKNIQPVRVKITSNYDANRLEVRVVSDDLEHQVTVYWQLINTEGGQEDQGNLSITGADYQTWNRTPQSLFDFVASNINVTLI